MTVAEVIRRYDEENANEISTETKVRYIKTLERAIVGEIVKTHELPLEWEERIENYIAEEGMLPDFWDEHFRSFDLDTEVIADEPYDEVYLHYINTRVAQASSNTVEYNRVSSFYTTTYIAFQDYWNRHYRPLTTPIKLIHHRLL